VTCTSYTVDKQPKLFFFWRSTTARRSLCSWSVGVEFFAGVLAWSCCWPRYIQTTFENVLASY